MLKCQEYYCMCDSNFSLVKLSNQLDFNFYLVKVMIIIVITRQKQIKLN